MSKFFGRETLFTVVASLAIGAALLLSLKPNFAAFSSVDNVATVNGTPIPKAELARALDAMQASLKRQLNDDDRQRALTLLINEELLVQQALQLELASDDRLIRKNLVQALINSVTLMDESVVATGISNEAQLQAFFEKEKSLFAQPRQVTLQVFAATADSAAQLFIDALDQGLSFEAAGKQAKFEPIAIAPGLPIGKLGDLLGGPARDAVINMQKGDIIGPVNSIGRKLYIWMTDDQGGPQTFDEAKDQVQKEWQRRAQEQALDRYLARLRKQARITLNQD